MADASGPLRPGAGVYAGVVVDATQRAFISSGLSRGLSGAETLRQMRAAGLAPREQAFYDVRRELQGITQGGRILGNTPKRFVPSQAAYPTSQRVPTRASARQQAPYRTTAKFTTTVTVGDETHVATFTAVYNHRTLLPMETLDAHLLRQLGNALAAYEIDSRDVSFSDYTGESFDV